MWCIVHIVLEKGDFSDHNEVPVMYNLRSLCSTIQFLKGKLAKINIFCSFDRAFEIINKACYDFQNAC